jgi:hypothetical protein
MTVYVCIHSCLQHGNTPLHSVCSARRPSATIIKILIAGEAKINIANKVRSRSQLVGLARHGDAICVLLVACIERHT